MGPRPNHRAFSLPRNLRPVISHSLVVDLFVERNDDLENHSTYFAFSTRERAWRLCEDFLAPAWESPRWSEPSVRDVTPLVFKRVIEIIKRLTETASPAEQRRCLSHAFISGTIKLLEHDERCVCEPFEFYHPPRPKRLEREAAYRDAQRHYTAERRATR